MFGLSLFRPSESAVKYLHLGRRKIQISPPPGEQDQSYVLPQGQQRQSNPHPMPCLPPPPPPAGITLISALPLMAATLIFKCTEGAGVGDYSSRGRAPLPLRSCDTHARWQPAAQSARSRRSLRENRGLGSLGGGGTK